MTSASKSVTSGPHSSVRSHLIAGGAFASAGILALSLVVVPPSESDAAKLEVRPVQLSSIAHSVPTPSALLTEMFDVSGHGIAYIPVMSVGANGSATNPTNRQTNNVTLAALPTGADLGSILGPLINNPIVGPIVLFAPLFILLIPALPLLLPSAALFYVEAAIRNLVDLLSPPAASASAAVAEMKAPAAAEPLNPLEVIVDNVRTLGDGLAKSAGVALSALPNLALLPFVTALFSLLAPQQIPTVVSLAAEGLDSFWNGVRYPNGFGLGINLGYDEIVPGFYIPTDTDPTLSGRHGEAYSDVVDGTILPATVQAINRVLRNLTAAGVPEVVEQTLLSLEKITIAVQQARVLVRGATVSAIQTVIANATSGGDVGKAVGEGFTAVRKAIVGDPDALDAHVDPYDPGSNTAPSIKQLGALGSVAASVKKAVDNVTNTGLVNTTVGEKKPQTGERTIVGSADLDNNTAANPTRQRPIRNAVRQVAKEIKNVVKDVRANVKKALSGGRSHDSVKRTAGEGETS